MEPMAPVAREVVAMAVEVTGGEVMAAGVLALAAVLGVELGLDRAGTSSQCSHSQTPRLTAQRRTIQFQTRPDRMFGYRSRIC